jgi:hypothetical protein
LRYAISQLKESQMKKGCFLLIGLITIFLISTTWAGPSRLEMDYGTSYKLAKFNQILNPDAGKNLEPVTGIDGQAANAAIGQYRKGFEEKPPPPVSSTAIRATTSWGETTPR